MIQQFYRERKDGTVEPIDIRDFGTLMRTVDRTVRRTRKSGVTVSTCFLGFDDGYGLSEKPLLYETRVFGGELDGAMRRYATRKEAIAGHRAVVWEAIPTYRQRITIIE